MRKVLVTGGAGFIGSHLVTRLAKQCEVVVLDDLSGGNLENLTGVLYQFEHGSVAVREDVDRAIQGCDIVYHLAAEVSVPRSMEDPLECLRVNGQGTLNVLQSAVAARVRKVMFASSAAVYGDNPESPKREDMRPAPKSPYGITKLDGEYYLEMFFDMYGLQYAAFRFFNVFGPRQNPQGAYAAAVPIFVEKAKKGEVITIHGDGQQTRDFIYVDDIVLALISAASDDSIVGVFNLAGGKAHSILQLANEIVRLSSSSSEIIHQSERVGDIRDSIADVTKLKTIGYTAETSLDEGLKSMIW